MTSGVDARWRELEPLLDELLELEEGERRRRLDEVAAADPELAGSLARLLAADGADRSALDLDAASLLALVEPPSHQPQGVTDLPELPGFEALERVGAGGSAEVFRARAAGGGPDVAIKLLRPQLADGELERRFARERELLAALDHPGIARLLDFGVAGDGRPFLVLEWVEGEDLARWSERAGRTLAERVAPVGEVAAALAFAHASGVAHRDIKPSNVRVGADGRARLLDFGLAKLLAGDGADVRATRSGVWLFTPDYAAPEQIVGKRPGLAADVWGLGQLLFEVATGRRPFTRSGRPLSAVISGLRRERPPKGEIGDRALERIVADCLAFDPDARPTAAELAAALASWREADAQRGAPRWRSKKSVIRR